jgi:uncharacterized ferritin-like protein (DUF455 family)
LEKKSLEVIDFAKEILSGAKYEDKLFGLNDASLKLEFSDKSEQSIFELPHREKKITLTSEQVKFPKGHFHKPEKLAIALNSFANHELLATEIMANMLLFFPHETQEQKRFKRGIFSALRDEQKHLKLYVDRLNEIGYEFGDFPLNDYFWRQSKKITSESEYLSIMSITFEGANLDFAALYRDEFKKIEDFKTAEILETVLKDEISHVAYGVQWLSKWKEDKSLWQYYLDNLPYPLTPARAKGKSFNQVDRLKAKMDETFLSELLNFDDEFSVTKRKEWK